MKTRITGLVCGLLLAACSPDLMDENTVRENNLQQARMQIDVRVSGTLVSTRTDASAEERRVDSYDIYVFDVATDALQHYEQGIVPADAERIAGTKNYRIGTHEVTLETSGQKQVFALANRNGSISLPALVTADEATETTPATRIADFRSAAVQTLAAGSRPSAPLVMAGMTFIASAADATVPVTLGRTAAKLSVRNTQSDRIKLSEVSVTGISERFYPFAETTADNTGTVDYAPTTQFGSGEQALALYLLPAPASQTAVTVKGRFNDGDFTCETPLDERIYADYDYTLSLAVRNDEVVATFSSVSGGQGDTPAIVLTGEWLSDKTAVTLPFTPEPHYGFTIGYTLSTEGTVTLERSGTEDWYDAEIVSDGTIRIRALRENPGEDRSAVFTLVAGSAALPVTVTQQGLAGVKTIRFGDLEWMDRSIGATLRASQAYARDIRSFGYLYQWGRSVPFPVTGSVETVPGQMTPAEALASAGYIAFSGGTEDWNAQGIEGSTADNWETVSPNPCPAGWRLPTYGELADVMAYRNNSLIFAKGQQKVAEYLPGGVTRPYNGFGSGAITGNTDVMCHYGIKNFGTADACYIRYQWINTGGTMTKTPPAYSLTHEKDTQNYMADGENILRIDRIPAGATATYATQAAAVAFWEEHETDPAMQTLIFPCGGRRDAAGKAVETRNAAFFWSRSMFSGEGNEYSKTGSVYASGLLYFRPAGRYMFLFAPALGTAQVHADTEDLGYRNQAMQIRCVKEK